MFRNFHNLNIHKKLILTLIPASLLLSLLFGGGGMFLEYRDMEQQAINYAKTEAQEFTDLHGALNHESLKEDLQSFIDQRNRAPNGHLVAVKIISSSGQVLADVSDGTQAAATAATKYAMDMSTDMSMSMNMNAMNMNDMTTHNGFWDEEVYVKVAVPLRLRGDDQPAVFSGLFLVDSGVIDAMKLSTVKTVASTILLVILTALFLYPLLLYLDRSLRRRTQQLLGANSAMLEALGAAIAKRDSETGAHNYRVTYYAIKLGETAKLSRSEMMGLLKGAFLHDIGKIGVRDAILRKPGKLTDDEFNEMKEHVQHGLDIVHDVVWFQDAVEVIGGHHEKWNGQGYPRGLAGQDIPITARIFAIADVFDALTSRRPYKEPFPLDKAIAIMREGHGQHFDPNLLDLFIALHQTLYETVHKKNTPALKDILVQSSHQYLDDLT